MKQAKTIKSNPMLDLFRAETEAESGAILKILKNRNKSGLTKTAIRKLDQAIRTIKTGASLAGVNSIATMTTAMGQLSATASTGRLTLSEDHLLLLTQATEAIIDLSSGKKVKDSDSLITKLRQIVKKEAGKDKITAKKTRAIARGTSASRSKKATSDHPDASFDSEVNLSELFRKEVEIQTQVLIQNILAMEQDNTHPDFIKVMMRAAHSVKGGANIAGKQEIVNLTHAMEDFFVAADDGRVALSTDHSDILLRAVDNLSAMGANEGKLAKHQIEQSQQLIETLRGIIERGGELDLENTPIAFNQLQQREDIRLPAGRETVVEISTESINRLLGLSGELSVETRGLHVLRQTLEQTRRRSQVSSEIIERLRDQLRDYNATGHLDELEHHLTWLEAEWGKGLGALEVYENHTEDLAQRMYNEVVYHRMRPFGESVQRYHRLVRDLGNSLGKEVRLEINGAKTSVDREILEKLHIPLTHMIQNAIEHGIESPQERKRADKPTTGTLSLSAHHSAGRLSLVVEDDGRGVDMAVLREAIIEKKFATRDMVAEMSDEELAEFLFLPKFSLKQTVSQLSGRGVGLDIVKNMVQDVRGSVLLTTTRGVGSRFDFQLPITLSIIRCMIVDIAGEAYAFPIARVERTLRLPRDQITSVENRNYFQLDDRSVGLVEAHQILGTRPYENPHDELDIVVLSSQGRFYGLVVDQLESESELVEQPLGHRTGKIKDIDAAAILEDGRLALILDINDVVRSIERIITDQELRKVIGESQAEVATSRKQVLVIDDSITVREVEKNLLISRGYDVTVAVDGIDGWNAVRLGDFDLVVTDIDMPRMDGIDLIKRIRKVDSMKNLPIIIVSYKDSDEDRRRGLDAGADAYHTKGSFHDDSLMETVTDIIGEA